MEAGAWPLKGDIAAMAGREPCISLHEPWASLLCYGVKRIEGREWCALCLASLLSMPCRGARHMFVKGLLVDCAKCRRANHRGRIWIHSTGTKMSRETVEVRAKQAGLCSCAA